MNNFLNVYGVLGKAVLTAYNEVKVDDTPFYNENPVAEKDTDFYNFYINKTTPANTFEKTGYKVDYQIAFFTTNPDLKTRLEASDVINNVANIIDDRIEENYESSENQVTEISSQKVKNMELYTYIASFSIYIIKNN